MTNDEARAKSPKLWAMIESAAAWAAQAFDGSCGPEEPGLPPVWLWENARGERGLIATPFNDPNESKTIAAAMVKLEFEKHDAVRFVFTSESWMRELSHDDAEREMREGLPIGNVRDHYDRREYVTHVAEEAGGASFSARHAIIRDSKRGRVGPLEVWGSGADAQAGRFAGMLAPRSDADRLHSMLNMLAALRRAGGP